MLARREPLDEREPEGERLAGARRRLAEDVAAGERVRNDERLDAEGLDDAAGGKRMLDLRSHAERGKTLGHTVFDSFSDSRSKSSNPGGTRT